MERKEMKKVRKGRLLNKPHLLQVKKAVVVTARAHPGETNGSWMMKGLLDFLTGPSADAKVERSLSPH